MCVVCVYVWAKQKCFEHNLQIATKHIKYYIVLKGEQIHYMNHRI